MGTHSLALMLPLCSAPTSTSIDSTMRAYLPMRRDAIASLSYSGSAYCPARERCTVGCTVAVLLFCRRAYLRATAVRPRRNAHTQGALQCYLAALSAVPVWATKVLPDAAAGGGAATVGYLLRAKCLCWFGSWCLSRHEIAPSAHSCT